MNISSHHFSIHLNPSFNGPKPIPENPSDKKQEAVNESNKTEENDNPGVEKGDKKESTVNFLSRTQKVESELSQQEVYKVRELSQRDREVRAHEQAHAACSRFVSERWPQLYL